MAPTVRFSIHQQMRPRKSRAKSGCMVCRVRRKKCDERRPTCRNCEKWQECCSWPGFQVTGPSSETTRERRPYRKSSTTAIANPISISPATARLVPLLPPSSAHLLEFFIVEASRGLSGRAPSDDPFVRLALQLSASEDLVKSGILAISGSRMSAMFPLIEVERAALYHYNKTITQLRAAVNSWPPTTGEQMICLLTTSILLCHYEAMLGNEQNSLQSHLRGCHEMVRVAQGHCSFEQYSAVYGVLFEAYAYYSVQAIFRYSACELDVQVSMELLQFYRSLTTYSTFGYLMLATSELYAIVPRVALFGLKMQALRTDDGQGELDVMYRRLESQILSWNDHDLNEHSEVVAKVAAIYRNSLLIILHASYLKEVSERSILEARLRPIINETMSLCRTIQHEPAAAPAFWPLVIVGSCLREETDRILLLSYIGGYGRMTSGIQSRGCEVLRWIWDHQTECNFGPAGLEKFCETTNTGLCIG